MKSFMVNGIRIEGKTEDLAMPGILLGLEGESNNTLALGLLDKYSEDEGSMSFLTPLKETGSVRSIQIGSVRLAPSFEDERF